MNASPAVAALKTTQVRIPLCSRLRPLDRLVYDRKRAPGVRIGKWACGSGLAAETSRDGLSRQPENSTPTKLPGQ